MAYQFALYEKRDHIAYVTINRPEARNALHLPAHKELHEIWCDFRDDPESWVAILTGAGERAFCAGADLSYMANQSVSPQEAARYPFGGMTGSFQCWKPIIAAVNGICLGGGCIIALSCDIVIAAEEARFGITGPRWGLIAGPGVHGLVRQIPLKQAMGLLLTAKQVSAHDAFKTGLINEVVPQEKLMARAEEWAREILECAPMAVRGTKQAALMGLEMPLSEAVKARYPLVEQWTTSEDRKEGPRAFAEKRKPRWKGR